MQQRVCDLLRMQPAVIDNRGLLFASGATVPTDGTDGYQTGCLFQHTDGGDATALYVNEGSVTSCNFNAIEGAGQVTITLDGTDTTAMTISGTYTTGISVTGTIERVMSVAHTVGTTTDGAILRVGSGIGTNALAMPDGARGFALYMRNTGTSGTLTGVRLRCVSDPASSANSLDGLLCQCSVVASKDATTINSGFFELIPKGTNTIGTGRVLLCNADSAASQTMTTQIIGHFRVHTRGDETITNDEMIRLENEAVGGNGRQLDSYIRCVATNISGGIKAAAYLIDGGTTTSLLATGFLRLPDDGTVAHDTDTGSATDLQFSDFNGFIKVTIGTAARYIPLLASAPSGLS